jgi:hypothetical protein
MPLPITKSSVDSNKIDGMMHIKEKSYVLLGKSYQREQIKVLNFKRHKN